MDRLRREGRSGRGWVDHSAFFFFFLFSFISFVKEDPYSEICAQRDAGGGGFPLFTTARAFPWCVRSIPSG